MTGLIQGALYSSPPDQGDDTPLGDSSVPLLAKVTILYLPFWLFYHLLLLIYKNSWSLISFITDISCVKLILFSFVCCRPAQESIRWFIKDQAFTSLYDLAPPPPCPSPVSKLSLFLSLPVCRPVELINWREGRGMGMGRSQIMRRRESLAN